MSDTTERIDTPLLQQPSIFSEGLFADKTYIVTGGGTGIGLAIAAELRCLGANVVIASRGEEKLRAGAAKLEEIDGPGEVMWTTCNIRKEESIIAAIDAAVERFGTIDGLVNNGGGQFPSPAVMMTPKGWNAVIDTNLTGTFFMSQHMLKKVFSSQGHGAIVNIIAQMWNGFPMMAHTGAARSGVDNLTKTLAFEWSSLGVRVNAVAPGVILSSGVENYSPANREFFFGATESIPAGRLGTPREIAAATVFLLTPAANFITGTTLKVDGGEPLFGHSAANQMRDMLEPNPTDAYE